MKKIAIISGVIAMTLFSCQNTNEFKLIGKDLPTELNGKNAFLYEGDSLVDSIKIQNGEINYTSPVDTTSLYTLIIGKYQNQLIKEPGQLSIISLDSTEGNGYKLVGGKYTALLDSINKEEEKIVTPAREELKKLFSDDSVEDDVKQARYTTLQKEVNEKINALAKKYYEANRTNAIAIVTFQGIQYPSDSAFIVAYEAAPEHVQSVKALKSRYENNIKAAKTTPGNDYVDFEMKNKDGEMVKLSSYMVPDQYLLLDFWASWCGPCRNAMPHLAELNKQYAKLGLNILSIGTWDKPAANAKAIEELEITWNTVLDTESVGASTYGIMGIPTLILIAPDGKILVRTHIPSDIDQKLKEIF